MRAPDCGNERFGRRLCQIAPAGQHDGARAARAASGRSTRPGSARRPPAAAADRCSPSRSGTSRCRARGARARTARRPRRTRTCTGRRRRRRRHGCRVGPPGGRILTGIVASATRNRSVELARLPDDDDASHPLSRPPAPTGAGHRRGRALRGAAALRDRLLGRPRGARDRRADVRAARRAGPGELRGGPRARRAQPAPRQDQRAQSRRVRARRRLRRLLRRPALQRRRQGRARAGAARAARSRR